MAQVIFDDALSALKRLPECAADMCVTSPPYYNLRDYGIECQVGTEKTPEEYIKRLVDIFHEVKRVLKDDGTLWIVIADSYAGSGKGRNKSGKTGLLNNKKQVSNTGSHTGTLIKTTATNCKSKDLIGIPWLLALSIRDDGWYLRSDIIWDKSGNVFPESVKDRCTKSHEYIFMLAKSQKYYYDAEAIKEPVAESSLKRAQYGWHGKGVNNSGNYAGLPQTNKMGTRFVKPSGRNKRDVWHINTHSYSKGHYAAYPPELIRPCIKAGSRARGIVLDPFLGSGTTALVALQEGRDYIGIELQKEYEPLIYERIGNAVEQADSKQYV